LVCIIIPCENSNDRGNPLRVNDIALILPLTSNIFSGEELFIPIFPSFLIVNTSVLILETDNILFPVDCLIVNAFSNVLFSINIFFVFKFVFIIVSVPFTYKFE
jgi:hypothetical protein